MKKYRLSVILMLLIMVLQGMVFYSPIATLYRISAGINLAQMGFIDSLSMILCIALELPLGALTAKIGYKKMLILSNLVFFISKIVFWKADSFGDFLIERLLISFAVSGLSGCDTAYLYLCAGKERSQKVFGLWDACGQAGLMVAGFVFSMFIGENYRFSGFLTVVTYAIASVLCFFIKSMPMQEDDKVSIKEQIIAVKNHYKQYPRFPLYLLAAALMINVENTVVIFFAPLLYQRAGIDVASMGWLCIIVNLVSLLAAFSDKATKALGAKRFFPILLIISVAACIMLIVTKSALLTVACIIVLRLSAYMFRAFHTAKQNHFAHTASRAVLLSGFSMQQSIVAAGLGIVLNSVAQYNLLFGVGVCAFCYVLALVFNKLSRSTVDV